MSDKVELTEENEDGILNRQCDLDIRVSDLEARIVELEGMLNQCALEDTPKRLTLDKALACEEKISTGVMEEREKARQPATEQWDIGTDYAPGDTQDYVTQVKYWAFSIDKGTSLMIMYSDGCDVATITSYVEGHPATMVYDSNGLRELISCALAVLDRMEAKE